MSDDSIHARAAPHSRTIPLGNGRPPVQAEFIIIIKHHTKNDILYVKTAQIK